jgi:hypothetical protein
MKAWVAKLTLAGLPNFAEPEIRRKLYVYLFATLVGVSAMLCFGVALAIKGAYTIALTDFVVAALLILDYFYLRATKRLYASCLIGALAMMGFLLVHLITGGIDGSGPVWFFSFPPLTLYLLGPRLGLILSLILAAPAAAMLLMLLAGWEGAGYSLTFFLRFLISYLIVTFTCFLMESQRAAARKELKVLSGMLPICSNCKKIRDENGDWNQIESYVAQRSSAKFTHSICPECRSLLYPDLEIDD